MRKRKLLRRIKALEQDVQVLRQRVADLETRCVPPSWVYWTPTEAPKEYKITCTASSADPVPHELVP